MKWLVIPVLLLVLSATAHAATITFRSGDHDGFARLVLDIPVGADWHLGRLGNGYALDLGPADDFDLQGAFDRIQRNRLAGLTSVAGSGRLALDLACVCHVTGFLFRPDKLVIDIIDGPAPEDSAFETAIDAPRVNQTAGLPLFPDAPVPEPPVPEPPVPEPPAPEPPGGVDLLPDRLAAAADARVSATERAIIESLARAATQGLLNIDPTAIRPALAAMSPSDDPPASHELPPVFSLLDPVGSDPAPLPSDFPISPGVSVQTAIDRDRPADPMIVMSTAGSLCLDDGLFDLAAWGDDSGFGAQIGARLSALTTERDQFPEGAVEDLVRSYLYFGFGREAEQVLGLDGLRSPDREVLRILSQIMDGDPVTGTALQGQAGCSRPVALWAALARGNLGAANEAERTAILSAHRLLPLHLRSLLGPRLAQLFLDAGEAETAAAIIATSDRVGDSEPPAENLTSAEITLVLDGPEAAIAALEGLAADPNRMTPETLIALIDLSIAEGKAVPDALISLASSMRFERRGTEAETALGLAEVRALTEADRFFDALSRLADGFGSLDQATTDAQATQVFSAMVTRLPDAGFLAAAFRAFPIPPSATAENLLADRLLALGFPDEAARFISGPASGAEMADRRYIRASVAVAMGQFADAESALAGMTDPRALAIRASLPVGPGPADNAPNQSVETLWQAGAWDQLAEAEDPLLRAASQAMLTTPDLAGPGSTLAERQALLDDSASTRTLAADLLARFAIDPAAADIPTN